MLHPQARVARHPRLHADSNSRNLPHRPYLRCASQLGCARKLGEGGTSRTQPHLLVLGYLADKKTRTPLDHHTTATCFERVLWRVKILRGIAFVLEQTASAASFIRFAFSRPVRLLTVTHHAVELRAAPTTHYRAPTFPHHTPNPSSYPLRPEP